MIGSSPTSWINPFASRYTHPVHCQFLPPPEIQQLTDCIGQFTGNHFLGQIVGPHGCGKTTLSVAIASRLQERFEDCALVTLGNRTAKPFWRCTRLDNIDWLPSSITESRHRDPRQTLILLDGIGGLSTLKRRLLIAHIKRHQLAVLLTSHRALVGVPLLARLRPSLDQFKQIVESLSRPQSISLPPPQIAEIYHRNQANYRLGLRECYEAIAP